MTDLRQRIARAIHRYDNQHALSGNDVPSEHHYGEADAVLAVLTAPAVGQPAEAHDTEARPPRVQWRVEGYDADEWNPLGLPEDDRDTAVAKRAAWARRLPGVPTRLVRETTTWTVEDER